MTTSPRRLLLKGTWLHREDIMGLFGDYREHKEAAEAAILRFKTGEISEADFRLLLGGLRYSATEIESEITQCKQEIDEGM